MAVLRLTRKKRTLVRSALLIGLGFFELCSMAQTDLTAGATPASEKKSVIGYATVAEALAELKAKPGVEIQTTKPDAWIIINEPGGIQWSFAPSTHAAHPAVVRRTVKVNGEGGVYIEMNTLCQAEKVPCDKLVEEFKELNDRIRQSVRAKSK